MSHISPFYPIDEVRAAAAAGRLIAESGADTHSRELGYSREAVLKVLKNLDIKQFHKTYLYPQRNFPLDSYKLKALSDTKQFDDLYIKFALRGEGKSRILLVSFHLNR